MRKIVLLFLILSFTVACGNKAKSIKYGEMSVSDLVATKGEPIKEEEIPRPEGKMYIYENNEKYQIEKGVVVNSFKNPSKDQKMLLHWKHKYSECHFIVKQLDQKVLHLKPEEEYSCKSVGISLIYDPNIEQVVRVVEYAAE